MYRRAISSLGCPDLSLAETLALGRRHGISRFELRALGGSVDLPAQLAREFGSPAAFAARVAEAGAGIAGFNLSLTLVGAKPADREALLEAAPWADAAGVPWLRVFDGGSTLDDTAIAEARETLEWWRKVRQSRRIAAGLMVETHDLLLDAARIHHFLAAMPEGSVGLLWDAHHTWRKGGEDPLETWTAIRPHVVHIHVKDSVAQAGGRLPYTYVLPGGGEFPMALLREALARDYEGDVSLEWEKLWHPDLPTLEQALDSATANGWW